MPAQARVAEVDSGSHLYRTYLDDEDPEVFSQGHAGGSLAGL